MAKKKSKKVKARKAENIKIIGKTKNKTIFSNEQKVNILIKLAISLAIVLIVMILLLVNHKLSLTGNVISSPSMPSNCSDANIKAVWDSIFKESSNGITIYTNDTAYTNNSLCDKYLAYKNNSDMLYVLFAVNTNGSGYYWGSYKDSHTTLAYIVNTSTNYIFSVTGNVTRYLSYDDAEEITEDLVLMINETKLRAKNITNSDYAALEFINNFKIDFGDESHYWYEEDYGEPKGYSSSVHDYNGNESTAMEVLIGNPLHLNVYLYENRTYIPYTPPAGCIQNWTAYGGYCYSDERKRTYYYDTNYCYNDTGKPNSTLEPCDYDSNGIIGNFSNATLRRIVPEIRINNQTLNLSQIYNQTQKVELIEGNYSVVEFNWNFSNPINLENITLEKQDPSNAKGYLIINGIEADKSVIINKINSSSNSVCIKNEAMENITQISTGCNQSGEFLVPCPGTNSSYTCNLTDATHFKITGLTHSAVIEMQNQNQAPVCIPQNCSSVGRTCGSFTEPICNTTINCGSCAIGQECNAQGTCITPCVVNWNCTEFSPKVCPKEGKQSKTCIDLNRCNPSSLTKTETQDCEYKDNTLKIVMILAGVIIFLLIIVLLIMLILKKKNPANNAPAIELTMPQAPSGDQIQQ